MKEDAAFIAAAKAYNLELSRKYGAEGAAKKNANLTPERKSAIARNAAHARWAKRKRSAKS